MKSIFTRARIQPTIGIWAAKLKRKYLRKYNFPMPSRSSFWFTILIFRRIFPIVWPRVCRKYPCTRIKISCPVINNFTFCSMPIGSMVSFSEISINPRGRATSRTRGRKMKMSTITADNRLPRLASSFLSEAGFISFSLIFKKIKFWALCTTKTLSLLGFIK